MRTVLLQSPMLSSQSLNEDIWALIPNLKACSQGLIYPYISSSSIPIAYSCASWGGVFQPLANPEIDPTMLTRQSPNPDIEGTKRFDLCFVGFRYICSQSESQEDYVVIEDCSCQDVKLKTPTLRGACADTSRDRPGHSERNHVCNCDRAGLGLIYIYIYIYAHAPPMIHTKLLFLSSGSWEVGSLGCEKHRQGSNFPKILEAWKAKTSAGIKFPQNSQNLSNYSPGTPHRCQDFRILGKFDPCRCFRISGFRNFGEIRAWRHFSNLGCENIGRDQISPKFLAPSFLIDARILGILGKFDPCRCFRISGFRNFGEIRAWRHFSNLGCKNIGRDQISPKFLKPEKRKHRQGSNFPKIPKSWATIARALPIDARILGILGKFDPCRCFRISGFRNFGEIRAWRHFSNLGCENIGRDQISPKFPKSEQL